ncbi:MAG: PKD domain-containing protein, partial [Bacteroidales bacterium]|nr:PKD domain-containing protein [Candidatus Scybalocola fimicaballi]
MNKLISKGQLIVVGYVILFIMVSLIIKSCTADTSIRASVLPLVVEVGSPIRFSDSTYNASNVLWEFGNGDVSKEKSGEYVFKESGHYQVRLTVEKEKVCFMVNVKEERTERRKQSVKIKAPSTVVQNERVVFMAVGDSDNWRWEFGETGQVDSQEQNPIHVYSRVGVYEVRLMAANMMYPIIHTIEVKPEFAIDESTDVDVQASDDFKERLQQIIDERNVFNANYNYLLRNHLDGNSNVMVLINGTNENDFYSYCNGLKIMGKQQSTVILDVNPERDSNGRIKRLLV